MKGVGLEEGSKRKEGKSERGGEGKDGQKEGEGEMSKERTLEE